MRASADKSVPKPDAVLVLGMHRSGTSVTAGALGLLGLTLGERLLDPAPDNPKGYFEHADAVAANDALLAALDRSWNDVRALPQGWLKSDAARAAEQAIARQVLARFPPGEPWAIKDPRLCRLLPLWLRALSRRRLRAACVLVLRHPAEVAESLAIRDFMPPTASHILWLRHVLESIQGSAKLPRALLRYDQLLQDPAATLQGVGKQIGLQWTIDRKLLKNFVAQDDRHHRAPTDISPTDEWHALALHVHAALCGPHPWADVQPLIGDFERLAQRQGDMIELLGSTLRGSQAAHQKWSTRSVEAQTHAGELERVLEQVTALSMQRLDQLQSMRGQLDDTQHALAKAEQLSLDRLEQMAAMDRQLQASETVKSQIEQTAHTRMSELEGMGLQLTQTQQALADVEAQSVQRLEQLQSMREQLDDTQHALARVEQLGLDRLEEIQRLSARLDEANALALGRLDEVHAQAKAHETAEQLAFGRLAEIERLTLQIDEANALIAALRELLETLKRSLAWRITAPAHALESWIKRKSPNR